MKLRYKILPVLVLICLCMNMLAQNPISYSEFQNRVLDYSQTLKQSIAKQKSLLQSMKLSRTAFFPYFDASGSYQYRINDNSMDFAGMTIPLKNDSYSTEVGVLQPIYAGGKIYNSYKASRIQTEIASKSIDLTTDNVIYAAQVSYWSTAAQKELYKRMCDYVSIIMNLTDKLEYKYELGQISKTDLIQMQARLKEAELQRSNTFQQYKLALQNMNSLMGENPLSEIEIKDSISTVVSSPVPVNVTTALSNRPDFMISQLDIDYQKRQISLATSKYNPALSIGIKGSWGTKVLNIDGSTAYNSTAFASLQVPIFHWGARWKSRAAQRALLLGKEFALQDKRDQISKEVNSAWTSYIETLKQINIASENCRLAQENLELNTFSYDEGKLTILDVLSAQLTWIQAYTNFIQSEYRNKLSISDYEKSTASRYFRE